MNKGSIFGTMKLTFSTLLLLFSIFAVLQQCDSLPGSSDLPEITQPIRSFTVNPAIFDFTSVQSVKDTTIRMAFEVHIAQQNALAEPPIVHLYDKGSFTAITSVSLSNFDVATLTYSGEMTLIVNTGVSSSAILVATGMTPSNNSSNFIRKELQIKGLLLSPPVIESTINPDTVFLPTSGSINFLLGAKVTHSAGQQFISRVLVNLRDQNNQNLGDFLLFDDGSRVSLDGGTFSGDLIAADSIFSRSFSLNSGNQPDIIQLRYRAFDVSEQESNSVLTTLVISR